MQKEGPLNFLTLVRRALKKNYPKFSGENWVYMLFYGVDPKIFMAKKEEPKIFWGLKGGGQIFTIIFFFLHQAPWVFVFVNGL